VPASRRPREPRRPEKLHHPHFPEERRPLSAGSLSVHGSNYGKNHDQSEQNPDGRTDSNADYDRGANESGFLGVVSCRTTRAEADRFPPAYRAAVMCGAEGASHRVNLTPDHLVCPK